MTKTVPTRFWIERGSIPEEGRAAAVRIVIEWRTWKGTPCVWARWGSAMTAEDAMRLAFEHVKTFGQCKVIDKVYTVAPWTDVIAAALDLLDAYIDDTQDDQATGEGEGLYDTTESARVYANLALHRAALAQAREALAHL